MTAIQTIGFIGTGAIASAMVKGICTKKNSPPTIYLSPQSYTLSSALASEFLNVHQMSSNAAVLEKSEIIVLSVRPEQLHDALRNLSFRPSQTVISLVATVSLATLKQLVTPAIRVCRATPLAAIERGQGPIVITPELTEVTSLFEGLGDLLIASSEQEMMSFGCAAALISSFYQIEETLTQWLINNGACPSAASLYVRSMFASAANSALEQSPISLNEFIRNNETPGGLNERVRLALQDLGLFHSLPLILSSISSLSLTSSSN